MKQMTKKEKMKFIREAVVEGFTLVHEETQSTVEGMNNGYCVDDRVAVEVNTCSTLPHALIYVERVAPLEFWSLAEDY